MEDIHDYVRKAAATSQEMDLMYHKIIPGGDQLTVAQVRGLQAIRSMEDSSMDRFNGLLSISQDWHARVKVLKVCSDDLYMLLLLVTYTNMTHADHLGASDECEFCC